ncbi:FAD-dependent oxidoreductase [Streptomyces prasinus]|uniref:FAD-dependent oxidoreductase n=1 Tax=Streptomyces prasinus TaxID=67345 RepID=UPI003809BDB8
MTPATPPTEGRPDVIIVGGGIGGLSTAFALAREGLRIRVLERAPEFGEVGAGLQIAPNCTRILDEYGLLDEAKELGVVPENMVMRDALDSRELIRLDLGDLERRYGFPYMVIHRSDLHAIFLRACRKAGVDLVTDQTVVDYENLGNTAGGARITLADGRTEEAPLVIAADGLRSVARQKLVGDDVVSSDYVAYRAAVPIDAVRDNGIAEKDVTVYVGPRCHFVQYALRGGDMFNQVAVFQSPKALAGQEDWGTPDELDAAFEGTCETVGKGIPLMWRDRWWQMMDRDPIDTWIHGRIALLGDAAHPPLQYMAQGAIMAIEDGWVLSRHVARLRAGAAAGSAVDWDAALAAYEAVRVEHCRRILTTARAWGELWHLDGTERLQRNAIMRGIDPAEYAFTDWVYGPTALFPDEEPPMFRPVPLASARIEEDEAAVSDASAAHPGAALAGGTAC